MRKKTCENINRFLTITSVTKMSEAAAALTILKLILCDGEDPEKLANAVMKTITISLTSVTSKEMVDQLYSVLRGEVKSVDAT